jgi:hypothetical protein
MGLKSAKPHSKEKKPVRKKKEVAADADAAVGVPIADPQKTA